MSSNLTDLETVIVSARKAKRGGATRFCMGAAWRSPKARDMERLASMVRAVKGLGLETCNLSIPWPLVPRKSGLSG